MQKTEQKIQIGNRMAIVYEGPRGGKYVKKNGKFVSVKNIMKGGQIDYEKSYVACDSCNPATPKYQAGKDHVKFMDSAKTKLQGVAAFDMNRIEKLAAAECFNDKIQNNNSFNTENPQHCSKRELNPEFVEPTQEQHEEYASILGTLGGGKKKDKKVVANKNNKKQK